MINIQTLPDKDKRLCGLMEYIIKQIVDSPDEVEVRQKEGRGTVVLEVSVAKEDTGKVIGKRGRVVDALRTIVGAVAASKFKKWVMVEVLKG
ncbi:KH domain-containing protein [Candidatus Aerophobetes bacterium]|nr:KH domain-containing protein [Candidatus Aerophobetes bacterium]